MYTNPKGGNYHEHNALLQKRRKIIPLRASQAKICNQTKVQKKIKNENNLLFEWRSGRNEVLQMMLQGWSTT
jgi:hypothetical protein